MLPAQVVCAGVPGVVGAIGFTHFLASSLLSGIPQAFLIILFTCSRATSLLIQEFKLPIVFAKATRSLSDNAHRLTQLLFSSHILSTVKLLFMKSNLNLISGLVNIFELLIGDLATAVATLYRLLSMSEFKSHSGMFLVPPAPHHTQPHQPNAHQPTGMSYLCVSGFR